MEHHVKKIKPLTVEDLTGETERKLIRTEVAKEIFEEILPEHVYPVTLLNWANSLKRDDGYESQLSATLRHICNTIESLKNKYTNKEE